MTSIPAAICRIYGNKFKRHYLRNKSLFLDFLLNFWSVHFPQQFQTPLSKKSKRNLEHFKKKMDVLA